MSGCFDLVLRGVATGTGFSTTYDLPGFFLSGLWFQPSDVDEGPDRDGDGVSYGVAMAMATLAFLHLGFFVTPFLKGSFLNIRLADSAAWFYAEFFFLTG